MKSVRKGLRDGDLERDTYERLSCTNCGVELKTVDDPNELGSIRVCRNCGSRWQQL